MSKYPFEVKWDGKLQHYVAWCRKFPDMAVMAKTRALAVTQMRRILAEKVSAE